MADQEITAQDYQQAIEMTQQLAHFMDPDPDDLDSNDPASVILVRLLTHAQGVQARHEQDEEHMAELRNMLVTERAELRGTEANLRAALAEHRRRNELLEYQLSEVLAYFTHPRAYDTGQWHTTNEAVVGVDEQITNDVKKILGVA